MEERTDSWTQNQTVLSQRHPPFQQKRSFFKSLKMVSKSHSAGQLLPRRARLGSGTEPDSAPHRAGPLQTRSPTTRCSLGSEYLHQINATPLLTSNTREHPQPSQSPSPTSKRLLCPSWQGEGRCGNSPSNTGAKPQPLPKENVLFQILSALQRGMLPSSLGLQLAPSRQSSLHTWIP